MCEEWQFVCRSMVDKEMVVGTNHWNCLRRTNKGEWFIHGMMSCCPIYHNVKSGISEDNVEYNPLRGCSPSLGQTEFLISQLA